MQGTPLNGRKKTHKLRGGKTADGKGVLSTLIDNNLMGFDCQDIGKDMSNPRKQQHYVPKALLAHFCEENSNQLYMLKRDDRLIVKSSINNVAKSKGLYNSMLDDNREQAVMRQLHYDRASVALADQNVIAGSDLESLLGQNEDQALKTIRSIISQEPLKMGDKDKVELIRYVIGMKGRNRHAIQRARGKSFEMSFNSNFSEIASRLLIKNFYESSFDPSNMTVIVYQSQNEYFCISDNPSIEDVCLRGIGIGTFLPISPYMALGIIVNRPETEEGLKANGLLDLSIVLLDDEEVVQLNLREVKNSTIGTFFKNKKQAEKYQSYQQ